MSLEIKQTDRFSGVSKDDPWWDWSVQLQGAQSELDRVKYVEYVLHPSFPNPVRRVADADTGFRLKTAGWGAFTVRARVVMKDGTEEKLQHELELRYPDGSPTEL